MHSLGGIGEHYGRVRPGLSCEAQWGVWTATSSGGPFDSGLGPSSPASFVVKKFGR